MGLDHFDTTALLQRFTEIGQLEATNLNRFSNSITKHDLIMMKIEGKYSSLILNQPTSVTKTQELCSMNFNFELLVRLLGVTPL